MDRSDPYLRFWISLIAFIRFQDWLYVWKYLVYSWMGVISRSPVTLLPDLVWLKALSPLTTLAYLSCHINSALETTSFCWIGSQLGFSLGQWRDYHLQVDYNFFSQCSLKFLISGQQFFHFLRKVWMLLNECATPSYGMVPLIWPKAQRYHGNQFALFTILVDLVWEGWMKPMRFMVWS